MNTKSFIPIILFSFILIVSCKGKRDIQTAGSDDTSALLEEPLQELTDTIIDEAESSYPIITSEGIGPIAIGMSVNDIPNMVDGLYLQKEPGSTPDAVTVSFYDENGESFIAYDFGEALIDVIIVSGENIKVETPEGAIGIGSPFYDIAHQPDAEPEWVDTDDIGTWYWRWNGLWFGVAPESLSSSLATKLYNHKASPSAVDFKDSKTKIGFIGTGLPF